jgi:hypothetical protein
LFYSIGAACFVSVTTPAGNYNAGVVVVNATVAGLDPVADPTMANYTARAKKSSKPPSSLFSNGEKF